MGSARAPLIATAPNASAIPVNVHLMLYVNVTVCTMIRMNTTILVIVYNISQKPVTFRFLTPAFHFNCDGNS